jgi:hypothetical protein
MKDHEIAQTVNRLRDIANDFHGTGQLRERIARLIVPLLKGEPFSPAMMQTDPFETKPSHAHDWKPAEELGKGVVMCDCGFAKFPPDYIATAYDR